MKALIVVIVVVVVGLLAFNFFTTGELKLLPGATAGAGDDPVNQLRGDFRKVAREYRQAGRGAAIGGVDTTSAAEAALAEVDRIANELEGIVNSGAADEVKQDAQALLDEITEFKRRLG